ncbi:hypothetical protein D3C85_946760 [compost metagenome]
MRRRHFLEHHLRAEGFIQRVGPEAARVQGAGDELPERLEVLKGSAIRVVMVCSAVVHIGRQPDNIAHGLRPQEPQQLRDFQLSALSRTGVTVGHRFPARYTGAHFAVRYAQANRHVGGDDFPLCARLLQLTLEPIQLLTPQERFLCAQVVIVGPAIAAHVQHEHVQQRSVTQLAVDAPAVVGSLQAHRRIFEPGLSRPADQAVDIFISVALVQQLARRPVVDHFVVVPLPDLRHFGVEATNVFVHQVVAIITAILVEGFSDFALRLAGDVAPHPAAFGGQLRRHRAVGVDGIAAVDEEVRQAQTHGLVDTHAADVRVDAEALADSVTAPDKADIPTTLRHAAQVTEPGLAGHTGPGVFEGHTVENRLVGRQSGQLDARREIGAGVGQGRDEPARVVEQTAGVPLDDHSRRTIAAAPDHCPVAQQVTGLYPVGQLRTLLDRRDDRRSQARQQQPGTNGLHDSTTSRVEFAHGVLPEKGNLSMPE